MADFLHAETAAILTVFYDRTYTYDGCAYYGHTYYGHAYYGCTYYLHTFFADGTPRAPLP